MERGIQRDAALRSIRQAEEPKPQSVRISKQAKIAERRAKVAKLLRARVPQNEIAAKLELPTSTVNDDVKFLRAQWAKDAKRDTEELQADELAGMMADERSLRVRWAKASEEQDWDLWLAIYNQIGKLVERRMKLMGHAAPARVTFEDLRSLARQTANETGLSEQDIMDEFNKILEERRA